MNVGSVVMETPQFNALIQLLRDQPDLCDQVLKASDQSTRAHLITNLGFDVTSDEAPDSNTLAESLGFVD